MCLYVYRVGLDIGQGPMTLLYVVISVITACVSMIMCSMIICVSGGVHVRRGLMIDRFVTREGLNVGRGPRPSGTRCQSRHDVGWGQLCV